MSTSHRQDRVRCAARRVRLRARLNAVLAVAVVIALIVPGRAIARDAPPTAGELRSDELVVGLGNPHAQRGLLESNENGEVGGFAVEVMRESARAVGLKVKFVDLSRESMVDAIEQRRVDAIASMSIADERLHTVEFTAPILITRGAVFWMPGTVPATSASDLRAGRVVVAAAGVGHLWCKERLVSCEPHPSISSAIAALREGRADYLVTTEVAGRVQLAREGIEGMKWEYVGEDGFLRAYAMAVPRGEDKLAADLNNGLAIIRDNGVYDRLYTRWVAGFQRPSREASVSRAAVLWGAGALTLAALAAFAWQMTLRRALSRRTRELREAEANASRHRRRYQEIFDRSQDVILVVRTEDLTVVEANDRACAMYGYAREELVGASIGRVSLDIEATRGRINETLRAGGLRLAQHRQRARDGRLIDVDVSASVIDFDGKPAILALVRDVTERRRAEEERREMEARLQQAERLESLGLLAGGIAHDFNNLLVGVLGNAELIPLVSDNPDELARVTGQIVHSAQRAADLTQQLLAYAGRARLAPEPVDLAELGRETASLLGSRLSERAALRFIEPDEPARTQGDPTQLRQVVMNLLANASDALVDGAGTITVRCGNGRFERDDLGHLGGEPGCYSYIEVEDDGCGMDESIARRMFDPFFTTKPLGRGLGLAATLRTVQRHKGAISVRSAPGEGTTIRVFLPGSGGMPRTGEPKPSGPWRRGSVLIVDDEPAVREVTRTLLRAMGWACHAAGGGDEAIAMLSRGTPVDVVLMDLTMPGLSGSRLLEAIRRARPGVPVVVMTGYSMEAGDMGRGTNAEGHIPKPFKVEALDRELARVMRESAAPARQNRAAA